MAFLTIEDMTGTTEAVLFTEKYKEYKDVLEEGTVIAASVMLLDRDDKKSLQVDQIKKLT
jgi:DNA polymerase III alpha subunit